MKTLSRKSWGALIVVQLLFMALVLISNREKSLAFDEAFHLTSGYTHWTYNDYRLTPDNGNLSKRWIALPLTVQDLEFPDRRHPDWLHSEQFSISRDFVFHPKNDRDQMIWSGRVMMALAGVLLCVTVFLLSRRLFGEPGAWLSLFACALSPSILAHSRLMTSDLITSLTFLWALAALWQVLHRVTWTSLTLSALATTAVILSKFSGLIIVPLALILALLRIIAGRVWRVSLQSGKDALRVKSRKTQVLILLGVVLWHLVIGLFLIWLAYGFRFSMFSDLSPENSPQKGLAIHSSELGSLGSVVSALRSFRLVPESFLFGVSSVLGLSKRQGFFNGEVSMDGWRSYFPFVFAVKTGWAVLLALVLALFSSLKDPQAPGKSRVRRVLKRAYVFAPYLLFLAVFSTLAIRSSLNIGHRHILPLYPPIFLLLGSLGPWLLSKTLWKRGLIFLLGAVMLLQCVWIYPHYLSFFNGLVTPTNAYRHVVDSNVDWGQDLPRLKAWLDERSVNRPSGEEGDVYLSYFGFPKPHFYGVEARDVAGFHTKNEVLVPRPWKPGLFCVSVSVYQSVYSAAPGPWKPRYEKNYQRLKGYMEEFWAAEKNGKSAELRQSNPQEWRRRFFTYEHFSVARLCAYLKNRKPYDRIAYSILIFKLSEDDIKQAFEGPPPYEHEK